MQIKELCIYSPNLEAQVDFYGQTLNLPVLEKKEDSASIQIGQSILKIMQRDQFVPYHFAINIPSNQEAEGLDWLKERVAIIPDGQSEIQYFDFWDANAIYFYDADHNIVELIARKKLNSPSSLKFESKSLLSISEIGLPTFDIEQEHQVLKAQASLPIHSGSLERFCAIGDEEGLFIVINKSLKKEWYPTSIRPESADFDIHFIEKGKVHHFQYQNQKLRSIS